MVVTSKSYIFVITVRSYNMPERTGALKALSVLSLCSENLINGCLIFWFTSVCSVGVVIVRNGEIADSYYSLIRPEPEYYTYWNTRVHGLTLADTSRSPVFPAVWQEIAPRIEGLTLVAHNKAFDESCLKAVFRMYGMDYPDYDFRCTLQASRRAIKGLPDYQLHTVAAWCGYRLEQHHHALADAEACAWIARQII